MGMGSGLADSANTASVLYALTAEGGSAAATTPFLGGPLIISPDIYSSALGAVPSPAAGTATTATISSPLAPPPHSAYESTGRRGLSLLGELGSTGAGGEDEDDRLVPLESTPEGHEDAPRGFGGA